MEKFHEKLKVLRKKKGLTQKSLSNMLNISQSAYAHWEQGMREPKFIFSQTKRITFTAWI